MSQQELTWQTRGTHRLEGCRNVGGCLGSSGQLAGLADERSEARADAAGLGRLIRRGPQPLLSHRGDRRQRLRRPMQRAGPLRWGVPCGGCCLNRLLCTRLIWLRSSRLTRLLLGLRLAPLQGLLRSLLWQGKCRGCGRCSCSCCCFLWPARVLQLHGSCCGGNGNDWGCSCVGQVCGRNERQGRGAACAEKGR